MSIARVVDAVQGLDVRALLICTMSLLHSTSNNRTAAPPYRVAEVFNDLGARIAQIWGRIRYHVDALPLVAACELDRMPLQRYVDLASLLRWATASDVLPPQSSPSSLPAAGELRLTVFWHPSFSIEALFPSAPAAPIHGHGYTGAFQVLEGLSLQSTYEFAPEDPSERRCRFGRVEQTSIALLRPGSIQGIRGGEEFIHSAFHIGSPSVIVLVRAHATESIPHYTYFQPGVALLADASLDAWTRRVLQAAKLQATLRSPDLAATVARIGETRDLAIAFALLRSLRSAFSAPGSSGELSDVVSILGRSHGFKPIIRLAEVLRVEGYLNPLRLAYETIKENDLRFFLALLLTQQDRRTVLSQVAQFKGSALPELEVAAWIRTLATRGVLNLPSDEEIEPMLGRWLKDGRPLALGRADEHRRALFVRLAEQVKAEQALAPLFSGGPRLERKLTTQARFATLH